MPVPSVSWETAQWRLTVKAQAAEDGEVRISYRLENRTERPLDAHLLVVVRPFQVTPPVAAFPQCRRRQPDSRPRMGREGAARERCAQCGRGARRERCAQREPTADVTADAGARFGAMSFDDGFVASRLSSGALAGAAAVHDDFGFATGAFEFDLGLQPGASAEQHLGAGPPRDARPAAVPRSTGKRRCAPTNGRAGAGRAKPSRRR